MRVERYFIALLTVVMLPSIGLAQTTMTGDLTVRSDPQGAVVTLKGEASVSGVTPARFRHLLIGDYKLTLKKPGYETYSTRVELDPTRHAEIDIRLSPKTRFKTAVRSLFIPGWGQRYADKKGKGWAFTFLTALAGAGYYFADDEYDKRMDDFISIRNEFDSLSASGNIDELRRVQPLLAAAQESAHDAETMRRVVIGVGIGIWALNVIDALFFFPQEKGTFTVKGLTLVPEADSEGVALNVKLKF